MPNELETARRIFAGELAHIIEEDGTGIIPDALATVEEQIRTDFLATYRHCASMTALEPIRTPESLARMLRESVAMFVLVGKHDLAKVVRPLSPKGDGGAAQVEAGLPLRGAAGARSLTVSIGLFCNGAFAHPKKRPVEAFFEAHARAWRRPAPFASLGMLIAQS
jgi:hypothetical protein